MNNIFSLEEIGSSKKNLLLKTAGKVKIQFGKKMIDLLDNNGNINVPQIIKSVSSAESIKEDGFYLIDDELIASIGNKLMLLTNSSEGDTYVSFLVKQTPTSELKHLALVNIGFLYATLSDIPKDVNDGIVYVEDTQTLYTILNGVISEFKLSIPNPFPERFSILQGGLRLIGTGNNNGITFDNITIYLGSNSFNFDSTIPINFVIQGNPVLNIDSEKVHTNILDTNYLEVDSILELNINSITYPDNMYNLIRRLEELEYHVKVDIEGTNLNLEVLTTLNTLSKLSGTISTLILSSYLEINSNILPVPPTITSTGDNIINLSNFPNYEFDPNNRERITYNNIPYTENTTPYIRKLFIRFSHGLYGLNCTLLITLSN